MRNDFALPKGRLASLKIILQLSEQSKKHAVWLGATILGITFADVARYVSFRALLSHIISSPHSTWEQWLPWTGIFLAAGSIAAWFAHLTQIQTYRAQQDLTLELKTKLLSKFLHSSLREAQKQKSGNQIHSVLSDTANIENGLHHQVGFFRAWAELLVMMSFSFYLNSFVSVVTLLVVLALFFAFRISDPKQDVIQKDIHRLRTKSTSLLVETLGLIRTLKIFAAENRAVAEYVETVKQSDTLTYNWESTRLRRMFQLDLIKTVAIGFLVMVCGMELAQNRMSLADLTTFIYLIWNLTRLVREISERSVRSINFSVAVERIFQVLGVSADAKARDEGTETLGPVETLEFRKVSLGYPPESPVLLSDINLVLKKGDIAVLVGPNGQGKSTLLSAVPKLLDPIEGQILANGVPLTRFTLNSIRDQVSLVSQEIGLFDDSIRANILVGRPDASDADVLQAADLSGVTSFAENLEKGLDSPVGERAHRLSGGQAQRIGIARAMLKRASIFLLDEPTANLDHQTSQILTKSLVAGSAERITIVVTHQPEYMPPTSRFFLVAQGTLRPCPPGTFAEGSREWAPNTKL